MLHVCRKDYTLDISAKFEYNWILFAPLLPSPILTKVDFGSRNPVECDLSSCSVCKEMISADIFVTSVTDTIPSMISVAAWKMLQQSCPDLIRAHGLLSSGRTLPPKERHSLDIKFYLRKCTINKQGLLVHSKAVPWQSPHLDKKQFYEFFSPVQNAWNSRHFNEKQGKRCFSSLKRS